MNLAINVDYNRISPYAICFVLSFIISFSIASGIMIKQGTNKTLALLAPIANGISALYGGLLYTLAVSGQIGFSSIGGLLGLLLGNFILGKVFKKSRSVLWTAYCSIIPLIYSISKMGCFLVGCCYGIPYNGPFNVTYSGKAPLTYVHLFPVQLAEVIVFFGIFLLSYYVIYIRQSKHGILFCLVLCSLAKFSLEFLRSANMKNVLGINQIFCLVIVFVVILKEILSLLEKGK